MQQTQLKTPCRKWGLKINIVTSAGLWHVDDIRIDGEVIQKVSGYFFIVNTLPGATMDVITTSAAFGRLQRTVWYRRDISRKLKIRVYTCIILPLSNTGETWTLKSEDAKRLKVFEIRCLRAIMRITRMEWVTNETHNGIRSEWNYHWYNQNEKAEAFWSHSKQAI